jgi:transposase
MEVLHPRCAGLDVHKDSVVACVRIASDGAVRQEVRTFGTMTTALEELAEWLRVEGCTHAAMEATGVYWKPVWHVLEDTLELVLANAMHIKNVPGRKTDVNDATWIADLLAHGLIRSSFVPEASIQELRALTRTRKQFVREKAGHVQRLQKTLEDANLKIASVAADIMGASGRAILEALIAGETNPEKLADLTRGRLKASRATIVESLRGRVTANHRLLLKLHLDHIKAIDQTLVTVDKEVDALLEPFLAAAKRLSTKPGISDLVAEVVPAQRRERRQAQIHAPAQGRPLAQDDTRPGRVVRDASEEELPQRPVLPHQGPARATQGHHGGRRLDADGDLLHAA